MKAILNGLVFFVAYTILSVIVGAHYYEMALVVGLACVVSFALGHADA